MSKKHSLYIFIGALFILGISIGFFIAVMQNKNSKMVEKQQEQKDDAALFNSQNASIRGEITSVQGNKLTVKNLNTGSVGTITASPDLTIIRPGNKMQSASDSSALASLELNKEVLIALERVGQEYEATTIQYTTPAPTLKPIPSGNFKPSLKPRASASPAN